MVWSRLLYDSMIILYAASLVLFFVDSIQPRRTINRTALILLFAVFALLTAYLLLRLEQFGTPPVYSRFDLLLLLSWIILLVAVVVQTFFEVGMLLFFANSLVFFMVVFDIVGRSDLTYPHRQGDLLVLHIATAALSYAAFAFSFLFSMMYLIQERLLRKKHWNPWYFRLPALDVLDRYSFGSISVGLPLLLVSMILGMIWANMTVGKFQFWDPKPVATAVLWFMYGIYLLLRLRSGWGGRRLAGYSLICFIGVVINFLIVSNISVFHHGN